ncbi:MAG TPA: tetratricopeptide repeat protein [bacterium]|nr:tetratricopeptide repeat protein [bacterium]
MPRKHDEIIAEYLAAFRAQLRGLTENEKTDLVLELEDHILTRLAELAATPNHGAPPATPAASAAAAAASSAARSAVSAKLTDLAAVRAERAAAQAQRQQASAAARCAADYPPELVAEVLAGLGTPAELARQYADLPAESAPPAVATGRLSPRLGRMLLAIMAAGLLLVALASRYAWEQRATTDHRCITDPGEQRQYLKRLAAVCAAYRRMPCLFSKLESQSQIFGRTCYGRVRVFHADGITRLVPYDADAPGVRYSDTQTAVWLPALRRYEFLPPADIENSTYGPSLLLGLLRGRISDEQCRIRERDVQRIAVSDGTIRYYFTGAYFGYGDGEYTVTLDAKTNQLTHFSLRRLDAHDFNRSHYYSEEPCKQRIDLPLTREATDMPVPADAQAFAGIIGYKVRTADGWKGRDLVGRPVPQFALSDPRTGRGYAPADFRGRPLLLAVAATWVPHDRIYLTALSGVQERYARCGLQVAVLAPEIERAVTEAFLRKNPLPYPLLTDYTGWQQKFYRACRFYAPGDMAPTFLAVRPDGMVMAALGRHLSPVSDDLRKITDLLRPLLGDSTVTGIEGDRAAALARQSEEMLLARAEACFAREDDFTGKECLTAAITRHHSLRAKLRLCRLYAEYGSEESKQLAEECLAETTASPFPHLLLGDFYRTDRHKHERAASEYERALEIDRDCWQAHVKRGQGSYAQGEYERAADAYRTALKLAPDNGFIWERLAAAYSWTDNQQKRRAALRRALACGELRGAPDDLFPQSYLEQSDVATRLGEHDRAIVLSRQALAYDPEDIINVRAVARILIYDLRRPREALPLLDWLLHYDRNGRDYNYYGSACDVMGRPREALAMFELARRYDPSIEYTWMNIGLTREHMGDTAGARAAYERGYALFGSRWRHPNATPNPELIRGL